MAKKHLLFGIIAGAVITGVSILLMDPENGEELIEDLQLENELLKDKVNQLKNSSEKK